MNCNNRNTLDLTGRWKLRAEFLDVDYAQFGKVLSRMIPPETGKPEREFKIIKRHSTKAFPVGYGFMEANVPCDVMTPLVESGIVAEPFIKSNTNECTWTKDLSWWFIRDFEVDAELFANEEIRLFIEILDFNAYIIINQMPVKAHTNAFVPFHENVKRFLKKGKNQMIIRLTNGYENYYNMDTVSYYCSNGNDTTMQRVHMRKPQFTYRWDWCKHLPTCGIGGKVYLEGLTGANICGFRAETIDATDDAAKINLYFDIEDLRMYSTDDAILKYSLSYDGELVCEIEKELYLMGGMNYLKEDITITNPRLWWPNGYGDACQYTLQASVTCRNSTNSIEKKIGIRTLTIDHSKLPDGTREYKFIVNGVKVMCKGGNWVPVDSYYLSAKRETYETLVKEAKAANFTMLRIWGGGTYEPDYFYEFCSENGILLMHDFMYACAYYPEDDDSFLHEAKKEADYQTKRLANYPCMAIWTGNNEVHEEYMNWFVGDEFPEKFHGAKIFNYIQPEAVKNNSPKIPYAPSSGFGGSDANSQEAGDSHVWAHLLVHENKYKFRYEVEAFDRLTTRFSSEYGFHGAPRLSSVKRFMDGEEITFDSSSWKHHGEYDGKRENIMNAIDRHLTDASKLNETDYMTYSGVMQGMLYLDMALALRRKPYVSGDLIWMYNDCWPETGWTIIDYYLTRKISFYFLKRAFQTTKLIIRCFDGKGYITALNETAQSCELNLEYGYQNYSGETTVFGTLKSTLEPRSFNEIVVFDCENYDGGKNGYLYVLSDDKRFEPATSLRPYFREFNLPKAELRIVSELKSGSDTVVTVVSNAYCPVAYLEFEDDRTKTDDNFFELLPGIEKAVTVYGGAKAVVKVLEMVRNHAAEGI